MQHPFLISISIALYFPFFSIVSFCFICSNLIILIYYCFSHRHEYKHKCHQVTKRRKSRMAINLLHDQLHPRNWFQIKRFVYTIRSKLHKYGHVSSRMFENPLNWFLSGENFGIDVWIIHSIPFPLLKPFVTQLFAQRVNFKKEEKKFNERKVVIVRGNSVYKGHMAIYLCIQYIHWWFIFIFIFERMDKVVWKIIANTAFRHCWFIYFSIFPFKAFYFLLFFIINFRLV